MRAGRVAVVVLALALALLPLPTWWVEQWYSRGFYARIQPVASRISGVVPFALLDVAVIVLLAALTSWAFRRYRAAGFAGTLRAALPGLILLGSVIYLWFLAAWGMNYRRVPLQERLAYDSSRLTRERAFEFARAAVQQANALQPAAGSASAGAVDESLSSSLIEVQQHLGLGPVTISPPKRSLLGLYFRLAAIDGMTDPWFLEVIVNPDVLPSERPCVVAHEWAHRAGHADESEAHLVAWLACIRGSGAARYSGWLSAYQHVASGLPAQDRRALAALVSPPVAADLAAERARFARSSQRVRMVARGAYDTYLRANRVDEGIASYNAVVRLMLGASFDAQWNPQLR